MNAGFRSKGKALAGTVLITGITGFTGKYLRAALESQGYEVRGIADRAVMHRNDRIVNVLDAASLGVAVKEAQPHYVIHLAGVAFPAHDKPDEFRRVHEDGTRNLLQALVEARAPLRKVVLASSAYVYGQPARIPVDE